MVGIRWVLKNCFNPNILHSNKFFFGFLKPKMDEVLQQDNFCDLWTNGSSLSAVKFFPILPSFFTQLQKVERFFLLSLYSTHFVPTHEQTFYHLPLPIVLCIMSWGFSLGIVTFLPTSLLTSIRVEIFPNSDLLFFSIDARFHNLTFLFAFLQIQ